MSKPPVFDFKPLIDKHLTAPFRRARDWEHFYSESGDDIYDTYEYLIQIKDEIEEATADEKSELLAYVNSLEPLISQFMDLVYDAGFYSHDYDQLWHRLSSMEDNIELIKSQCK